MTRRPVPAALWVVAIMQFAAALLLPPTFYAGISLPIWGVAAVIFALLGINLLRMKDWARVATIFVQGFNIIVRLLTLLSNAVPADGGQFSTVLVLTSLASMALSGLVLYYVDQPDVQLLMQQ
jgi:hypothetical protein